MRLIPVLDIKNGLVVRARRGDRRSYAPIHTPLSADSSPLNVARGLASLAPFPVLYIADLDAIEGRPANDATVDALAAAFPDIDLWIDNGLPAPTDAAAWAQSHRARPVLGSESLTGDDLQPCTDLTPLSLDFRGDSFVGPPALLARPDLWPREVIVMTLARVGMDAGPDFDRLTAIQAHAGPDRRVYAAGGLRHAADLDTLAAMGIAGILVASALHDGRLSADDIARHLDLT
ncbi:HisA/HisF-related TIM barrel protein [Oryzibacter oryziterrae]|uniref:HisA/HisF-related TIM barrel protein n=1 Tax=Oryzibacter oryziterrae TaxID=2766474 RepID=UPI001F01FB87|nr:HisA/HisF-related TIM barrel protein [Oryzibacter oryziterrae]